MIAETAPDDAIDLLVKFVEFMSEEVKKGRDMIWIDKNLVEWVKVQVEAGIYPSPRQAIEFMIREKMKAEQT